MSYLDSIAKPINGLNFKDKSEEDLRFLFHDVLEDGLHGLCFSPYMEGQKPGDQLGEDQIRRRMKIIAPYTSWIRSFSCTDGNELIPKIAKEFGLKTLVGAWLGNDDKINQREIAGLIKLCKEGYVDIGAVGNEVMYRQDLTEGELLEFILEVKSKVKNIPIGYVDAYYEFTQRPKITEACDVILTNCYPYWEDCHIDYALVYMKQMYQQAKDAAKGKKVIITETGWPTQGKGLESAIPGTEAALKYFINTQLWSTDEDIDIFYFSSFDESWKEGSEGDVGAHWGLWKANEELKFDKI